MKILTSVGIAILAVTLLCFFCYLKQVSRKKRYQKIKAKRLARDKRNKRKEVETQYNLLLENLRDKISSIRSLLGREDLQKVFFTDENLKIIKEIQQKIELLGKEELEFDQEVKKECEKYEPALHNRPSFLFEVATGISWETKVVLDKASFDTDVMKLRLKFLSNKVTLVMLYLSKMNDIIPKSKNNPLLKEKVDICMETFFNFIIEFNKIKEEHSTELGKIEFPLDIVTWLEIIISFVTDENKRKEGKEKLSFFLK